MSDKFEYGPQNFDPHGPMDHHHWWGPHGPDGAYVPRYVWPDVYHPVPYGREYEGNQNLELGGEHWCPPRDHGRHGCHHEPCHEHHHHMPCGLMDVMGDYLETAQKYINATSYQERCDCVNELARIKVKIQDMLKEFDRQLDQNDKSLMRLSNKVTYYIGKMQEVLNTYDELSQAIEDINLLDYTDYYTKEEVDAKKLANPQPLTVNGENYDGSEAMSVTVPALSVSGKKLVVR